MLTYTKIPPGNLSGCAQLHHRCTCSPFCSSGVASGRPPRRQPPYVYFASTVIIDQPDANFSYTKQVIPLIWYATLAA
eukprot:14311189-Heterocapsa_arctica.AAC.1